MGYLSRGNCPGGNCPGSNCPGGNCPGGICSVGNCPGGICLWGNCPVPVLRYRGNKNVGVHLDFLERDVADEQNVVLDPRLELLDVVINVGPFHLQPQFVDPLEAGHLVGVGE